MTARSLSAALATGNACVIKSPEMTPLTNAWLARAAEAAGFPPGAVNVICGLGKDAGEALAGHRDVNQIVFTGSVPTGIAIATAAAQNVVPCVLELGGKSAAIVHADADLDAFENDIRWGIYFNAGQVCSAMSRVVVHESRHGELVERAEKVAKSLSVGPGVERTTFGANMGSMVSDGQRDCALGMITRAADQGAQIVAGGRKPKGRQSGCADPARFFRNRARQRDGGAGQTRSGDRGRPDDHPWRNVVGGWVHSCQRGRGGRNRRSAQCGPWQHRQRI